MIIWSGFGVLVPIMLLINSLIVHFLCSLITGNNKFYNQNSWTHTVVLVLTGVICWFLGKYLNRGNEKVYIDKQTGKEVRINRKHSLFFIKMQYWGPILGIVGLLFLIKK